MTDIDKITIEFQCPKCGFYNKIFFKQARLRDVIICRGCKNNIQLDDQMNECRKAEQAIKRAMQWVEESFEDINLNINIKI